MIAALTSVITFLTAHVALTSVGGLVGLGALSYFSGISTFISGIGTALGNLLGPLATAAGKAIPTVASKLYEGAAYCFAAGRGAAFVLTTVFVVYCGGVYQGSTSARATAKAQVLAEIHADYKLTPRPKARGLW